MKKAIFTEVTASSTGMLKRKLRLSNIEVEYEETNGHLYYFKYPLIDDSVDIW
jgi:hypothetical protein